MVKCSKCGKPLKVVTVCVACRRGFCDQCYYTHDEEVETSGTDDTELWYVIRIERDKDTREGPR